MTKATIYARVSLKQEADDNGESLSVARQLRLLRALAKREKYQVVAEHVDDGVSAYSGADRPGWRAVQADVVTGAADMVLAVAQDRLSRQTVDLLTFQSLCAKHGAKWHLHDRGVVDPTADEMVTAINAVLAQQESKVRSLRMQRALADRAASGKINKPARRAFGWTRDGDHHPVEGPLVTKAYADAVAGKPLGTIADEWNAAECYRTHSAKPHTSGSVRKVLEHHRNAGIATHLGKVLDGVTPTWQPLTDRDTFDKLAAIWDDNKSAGKRQYVSTSLLGGIAKCACGGTVQRGYSTTGARREIYRCAAATRLRNDPAVRSAKGHVAIAAAPVDEVVARLVAKEFLDGTVATALDSHPEADTTGIPSLRAQLDALVRKDKRLVEGYAAGVLSLADIATQRKALDKEKGALERRIAKLAAADTDRSWIDRARAVIDVGVASVDAAEAEFVALPLDVQRSLLSEVFDVQLLQRVPGRWTPDERVLLIFKGEPSFDVQPEAM